MKILFIGIFGLLGVYLRYFIDTYITYLGKANYIATFINNSIGCLIAGILYAIIVNKTQSPLYSAMLIGFCGGLTTFSSYNLQFFNLLQEGLFTKGALYLLLSPTIGILLIFVGYNMTTKMLN